MLLSMRLCDAKYLDGRQKQGNLVVRAKLILGYVTDLRRKIMNISDTIFRWSTLHVVSLET